MTHLQPRRCVHLDFHTSPLIPVGTEFSKGNFQTALKVGQVESITVFAKCHHGYCYYDTNVGEKHPQLDFDLTRAWVDAAHEIGVKAPIYITAGFSAIDAQQHPQWQERDKDGLPRTSKGLDLTKSGDVPMDEGAWVYLCLAGDGEYAKHIYQLTEEICRQYPDLDGLFYDIVAQSGPCYCDHCRAGMIEAGLDPEKEADAWVFYKMKRAEFMKNCGDILRKYHPDASIFFNSSANIYAPEYHEWQTHFEVEELPTVMLPWSGYDRFPFMSKYYANSGKDYIGMTGRFHLVWGEFGGYKTKEALKYEISVIAMHGGGVSVGDHCHPDGEMDLQAYKNIGYAFDYYEKIAPYGVGNMLTNIGLYFGRSDNTNRGMASVLRENQIEFAQVDADTMDRYDTLILPHGSNLSKEAIQKLQRYIDKGGKVLAFGDSIVKDGRFVVDVGAEYVSDAPHDVDYMRLAPGVPMDCELPEGLMLCFMPCPILRAVDCEVLAEKQEPYFSRTYAHYSGHRRTPYNKDLPMTPAIIKKGSVVYIGCDMAGMYKAWGNVFHKRYIMQALRAIYREETVRVSLGAQGIITAWDQPENHRICLNLLYGSPIRRGCAEVIEDIPILHQIPITLTCAKKILSVRSGVTGDAIAFEQKGDKVSLVLPQLDCHEVLVFNY